MQRLQAKVDQKGRVILPADAAIRYGIKPGTLIDIDEGPARLHLYRSATNLAKLYVEPTSACNLACWTCIQNAWEEPLGQMTTSTFSQTIKGLKDFSPPPTVLFGRFGEPLSHPNIVDMVTELKAMGSSVELLTNGTLLTWQMSNGLIKTGLDMLWVSLDGATASS